MTKLHWIKYGIIAGLLAAASTFAKWIGAHTSSRALTLVSKAGTSSDVMRALDSSFEGVLSKVSPAVVQIMVNGYGHPEDETLVQNLRSGDPVVLQAERKGKLQYLAFEME